MADPLDIIGKVTPPEGLPDAIDSSGKFVGITVLLNTFLRLLLIVGGIWALFNIVIAGIGFIAAGGDPKKVSSAWAKIYWSFIGLLIMVASFLVAAIIGIIFFDGPTALLKPQLKITP